MELADLQKKIRPILLQHGIERAGVFGSYARGEQTSESDVDVLVAFPKHATLVDVVRLNRELESVLQKKVDLVSYASIHAPLRSTILAEEVSLV